MCLSVVSAPGILDILGSNPRINCFSRLLCLRHDNYLTFSNVYDCLQVMNSEAFLVCLL